MKAVITTGDPDRNLEGLHMFAINWLDLKSKWLYNLYTYLAFPLAQLIGAKVIFKGYCQKVLRDSGSVAREVLLIVRYPGPTEFLSLVGRKIFQLISLLRIKSVKNFNLGFAHLLTGRPLPKDQTYLVYHWQRGDPMRFLDQVEKLCSNRDIQIFFSAEKVAGLSIEQGDKSRSVPLAMDGLLILAHTDGDILEELINDEFFLQLAQVQDTQYAGFFKRVL